MRNLIAVVLLVGSVARASSQDTTRLAFGEYMDWVRQYHPISVQAELYLHMGRMEVRQARGGFDPLLYGNLDKKNYGHKTYYDKREVGVTVPTWMGIELVGSYEQNTGYYLNPESTVPTGGLLAAGAVLNVQGLVMDERRAALRKAQIYRQSTEAQRTRLLNELYLTAVDKYWSWSLAYENLALLRESAQLAKTRFEAVKKRYGQGDLAAIDTVEAYTQYLNRQYKLQGAQNAYFMTGQDMEPMLWDEDGIPVSLNEITTPEPLLGQIPNGPDQDKLRTSVSDHPELRIKDFELAGLKVDRKLKAQQLIPAVKLKYNFLTESFSDFGRYSFFEDDYKWGVSFYVPLLWRKSRGALELAKAKIDFKQNDRNFKEIQLKNKLEAALNTWNTLNQQVENYQANVVGLEMLLAGEIRKFEIGESSLFLLNSREVSLLDSKMTLNEIVAKLKTYQAKIRYEAGLGFEN